VSYKLDSRSGNEQEFVDMVAKCDRAGVAVMVDLVMNHMASPYVQSPLAEQGKQCGKNETTQKDSTLPCQGWAGTSYGNRAVDHYEPEDFHHYRENMLSNCAFPPYVNNQHICDLQALPDLDTESRKVQGRLQDFIRHLFEIGVRMLRVDAGAHMYPDSMAQILLPFPMEYITFELYPQMLGGNVKEQVGAMGTITNFEYGKTVAERLFDTWDGLNSSQPAGFYKLVDLQPPIPEYRCDHPPPCDNPYSLYDESLSIIFLDNHDQQRMLWKGVPRDTKVSPVCKYDGTDIKNCWPMYKHGLDYHLGMLFMLVWPYGDAVRLMSSYAFESSDQGPPGVRQDSRHDPVAPVRCRGTPDTSPVTKQYDSDQDKAWVCEHRWMGVAAMVRVRQLLAREPGEIIDITVYADHHHPGRLAFEIPCRENCELMDNASKQEVFVAMQKGHNWVTRHGGNKSWELTGRTTGMPQATYCNLAVQPGPLPEPQKWTGSCGGPEGNLITVRRNLSSGLVTFVNGSVPAGGAVVLHVAYSYNRSGSLARLDIRTG